MMGRIVEAVTVQEKQILLYLAAKTYFLFSIKVWSFKLLLVSVPSLEQ